MAGKITAYNTILPKDHESHFRLVLFPNNHFEVIPKLHKKGLEPAYKAQCGVDISRRNRRGNGFLI
jgi:hypothetical protein